MATMSTKLEFVKLRIQMSDPKSIKESRPAAASTTHSHNTQPGSNRNNNTVLSSSSLQLTQTDLYNFLYKQNVVKPLSEEEIRKERENPTEIFWCSICEKESPLLCRLHGPLHCRLKSGPGVATNVLSTAIKSFPNEVQLCRSSIPGTKHGVIAKCFIPKGTWLGPFEGTKVRPDTVRRGADGSFMWEIFQGGQLAYFLDGSNEDKSSWMRFIACARHSSEQNLYAFQYCENIYYRAFKEIHPGTELLVWYDDNYPQFMGIPLEIRETEGIYQRAVDPSMKQNEVVVVVSSQEETPSYSLRMEPSRPPLSGDVRPMTFSNIPTSNVPTLGTFPTVARPSPAEGVSAARSKSAFPTQQAAYPVQSPRLPEASAMRRHASLTTPDSAGIQHRQGIRATVPQGFQPQFKEDNRTGMMSWQQATTSSVPTRFPISGTPVQIPPLVAETNMPSESQPRKRTLSEGNETASVSSNEQNENDERKESPNKENNAFQCGQCGKTFPQRSVLQIHVCPKQPYKPYHCGHCDRLFDDPNELRNHAIIHTNEKPFKCGYCSRSFSGATTLNNHIRTHTGEKPFECSVCGKTFSQASQLSRHEKIPGDCIEK